MSKPAASADLQAAAYWRNIARSDRSEINVAVSKIGTLTADARREEKEPGEAGAGRRVWVRAESAPEVCPAAAADERIHRHRADAV